MTTPYQEDDAFQSVMWDKADEAPSNQQETAADKTEQTEETHEELGEQQRQPQSASSAAGPSSPKNTRKTSSGDKSGSCYMKLSVKEPVKELEGSKDTFVSYAIIGETNLPHFKNKQFSARRRFQDFVFLRNHLAKDYPASVVPPIPDKHRMEYLTGDRFSPEFVERRRMDLNRFLQRIARHPTLARASLVQAFLESTEWTVRMHQHAAHPDAPEPPPSLLDNLSDTLLNAFAKVRKPDERFVEIREGIDKFEESLGGVDRIEGRTRTRINDLSNDYDSLSASIQGLAYLESGITEPLSRFEQSLLDFSGTLRTSTTKTIDPFLYHLSSLLAYSHAFRGVLKLRDQKQLDFEELSAYLSSVTSERDRLAAGLAAGPGIGSYLKSKVDAFRGGDNDFGRDSKIVRLDAKIKELQDAVSTAHDASNDFNNEVLREHSIFQKAKKAEMKELLTAYAEGQIAFYKKSMSDFQACVPSIETIRVS